MQKFNVTYTTEGKEETSIMEFRHMGAVVDFKRAEQKAGKDIKVSRFVPEKPKAEPKAKVVRRVKKDLRNGRKG